MYYASEKLRTRVYRHLQKWFSLDGGADLARDLEALDWELLSRAMRECFGTGGCWKLPDEYGPAPFLPAIPENQRQRELYEKAASIGELIIASGETAVFTVAGGQGTRLGFSGPKGTLGIASLSGKSLFALFADKIKWARKHYSASIPWIIMCSPLNLEETMGFFRTHGFFEMDPETVHFIVQGVMPVADLQGNLLLSEKGRLALAPDGHGGSIRALNRSGLAEMLSDDGVKIISYFQVDNPLIEPLDPLFIGLHHLRESQMSSRTVRKRSAREKTGVFAIHENRLMIIEYSDLPEERAASTDSEGEIIFCAASPAIHLISLDFLMDFHEGGVVLPFHKAVRKTEFLHDSGIVISPEYPNAVKFETFVFDAIPLAANSILLEVQREEQFSPVKNLHGEDTLDSARRDMVCRDIRWLKRAGINVRNNHILEIDRGYYGSWKDLLERAEEIQQFLDKLPEGCGCEIGETLKAHEK